MERAYNRALQFNLWFSISMSCASNSAGKSSGFLNRQSQVQILSGAPYCVRRMPLCGLLLRGWLQGRGTANAAQCAKEKLSRSFPTLTVLARTLRSLAAIENYKNRSTKSVLRFCQFIFEALAAQGFQQKNRSTHPPSKPFCATHLTR